MKVVVVGGGWAGCAAAITARKAGAEVHIYEKTDLLLGLGNVGGSRSTLGKAPNMRGWGVSVLA